MNDWFEAEQRIERAQQLSESQRWAEALAELDAALAINPNNPAWNAQRGYLLEELDRPSDAVAAYERALDLEPGDRDVTLALGAALTRLGRLTRSLEIFDELARTYPDFEPAYCHRIAVYGELGQHDQAEQMFYLAQELDDACPHCFFHMAESLAIRGQAERAIYCWQRVLEIEPAYGGVNRRIAQAYRAAGERDLAREYFLRELREDPGNTDLLFDLGELAMESGDVDIAAAKFAQINELEPEHTEARFALGRIWLGLGKAADALTCFEDIRDLTDGDPGLPEFDRRVGEALFQVGRYEEAAERFEAAARFEPENVELFMLQGTCLLAGGKAGPAGDCFRRVLARDANNPFAHHNLGVCHFQEGRHEAGLQRCRDAIRLKPDFAAAMANAAVALLRLARWSEASAMLRQARRHDPDNELLTRLRKRLWRYRLRYMVRKLVSPFRRRT